MSFPSTTYAFFPSLPNAPDYPGDDQPGMQTNAASTASAMAVDHVQFNSPSTGTHKQMSFLQAVAPPSLTGTQSVLFPGNSAGTSYATQVAPMFNNATASLLCGFNAFVRFNGNNGAVVSKFGVFTVSRSSSGVYVITWGTNAAGVALPTANYCPLITLAGQTNFAVWYELTSVTAGSMTISCFINNGSKFPSDPSTVSILIVGA